MPLKKNSKSVKEFYDELSGEYTSLINRCVPRYDELFSTLFFYIPENLKPKKILELGCGTGNLTQKIIEKYPNAEIFLVDISDEIIRQCKKRFIKNKNLNFINADFNDLNFKNEDFALIVSSIAIHHIKNKEKEILFGKVRKWLQKSGVFTYFDQFKGATDEIYKKNIEKWHEEIIKLGSDEKDWKQWMKHQDEHDYHATVAEQIEWLKKAKFKTIDVVWRYLLWTVVYAQK
ncbi:MAG: methyltransferase domain-containing protein [Bacteroidales bacterium]|nr:methyltransferase domain-containing protein [Bacteroidales bacterium]